MGGLVGGLVVGWMEVSMAKKALADLFQTQVSLTPSVFIRDMITEYCCNPHSTSKQSQVNSTELGLT